MATSIQQRGPGFQLRVTHKLLPRSFFFTFPSRPEAESYRDRLVAMLERGVVPEAMLARDIPADDPLMVAIIRDYSKATSTTGSESGVLDVLVSELLGVRRSQVTAAWADRYIASLKRKKRLAPGTIRKRVSVFARVLDWHQRQTDGKLPNPLRTLPRGYSIYSDEDAKKVEPKHDQVRDRRLAPDELERIEQALAGVKRADRERPWGNDPAFTMLYHLIVDTGMRLSEAYRLRVQQVDLKRAIIQVEGSKGARGKIKPRVVPIKPALRQLLSAWCEGRSGLLFPFWDGTADGRKKATAALSARFRTLFAYAGVPDFLEHDLRHEATCRWVLLRHPRGGWLFSELEICKIMGWSDTRMMLRYASLRGEDLADRFINPEAEEAGASASR